MNMLTIVCRVLLGLGFAIFGANILHPFMPQPPMPPSPAKQFVEVMMPSHWMALVGVFQLTGGILVLIGRTAPLGLVLLGPVLVNILAFHILLMHGGGIAPGLVFTVLEMFLIYAYRRYFSAIFTTHATPSN